MSMLTSLSVDEILLLGYMNSLINSKLSFFFQGLYAPKQFCMKLSKIKLNVHFLTPCVSQTHFIFNSIRDQLGNYHSTVFIGLVFANGQRDRGSYQRLLKWYLIRPCLTLSNIRYVSRVKWRNPGKGVAQPPTPWCSSYRKRSLQVALDYGRQLYFTFPCTPTVNV